MAETNFSWARRKRRIIREAKKKNHIITVFFFFAFVHFPMRHGRFISVWIYMRIDQNIQHKWKLTNLNEIFIVEAKSNRSWFPLRCNQVSLQWNGVSVVCLFSMWFHSKKILINIRCLSSKKASHIAFRLNRSIQW